MLIAQITDFHVVPPDSAKGKLMGTKEYLEAAVDHVLALRPTPVAVLGSGDLVDDGTREEYEVLVKVLAPLKARLPLYVGPGNHDDREIMREVMREHGYDYLPTEGPLQYVVDLGELRLISLDTLVTGEPGGLITDESLLWLDERLSEDPRPTIIMQHHPPFATGLVRMDSMGLADIEKEAAVLRKHSHVLRIVSGHLHRTIYSSFAGTLAMTAPSCAHAVELDLETDGRLAVVREPPAAAVHLWRDGHLVSHTSFIGDYGPPFVITD